MTNKKIAGRWSLTAIISAIVFMVLLIFTKISEKAMIPVLPFILFALAVVSFGICGLSICITITYFYDKRS